MKYCRLCNRSLSTEVFNRQAKAKDGLYPYCRECQRENNRRYMHRPENKIYYAEYYQRNRFIKDARSQAYIRSHRAEMNLLNKKYRALKRGATHIPFTVGQLRAKIAYWGNSCWVCSGNVEAIDHYKPISKGGLHILANLRPICTSCNSIKRDKWPYYPRLTSI